MHDHPLQVTAVSIMARAQLKTLVESSIISILNSKKKQEAPIMIKFEGQWPCMILTVTHFSSWERKAVKQYASEHRGENATVMVRFAEPRRTRYVCTLLHIRDSVPGSLVILTGIFIPGFLSNPGK